MKLTLGREKQAGKTTVSKGKAAPAKKASKKSRSSSGPGGLEALKAAMANHIEKVLVGLIALLSLWLIFSGYRQEGLRADRSPEQLQSVVNRARTILNDESTWDAEQQNRYPQDDNFVTRATKDTINIQLSDYELPVPFHPLLQEQGKLRTDPQLLAPIELEVHAGYGPLAVRESGSSDSTLSRFEFTNNNTDTRPIPAEYKRRYLSNIETRAGGTTTSVYFASIKALVPAMEQYQLYEETFQDAAEYDPERDVPRYRSFFVERREVLPNGQFSDWSRINPRPVIHEQYTRWANKGDEYADSRYLLRINDQERYEGLTMALPPLVGREFGAWAVHSKVPREAMLSTGEVRRRDGGEEPTTTGGERIPFDEPMNLDTFRTPRPQGEGEGSDDRTDVAREAVKPKVDYYMLRYLDFNVQPGKSYQYRVQLVLEDPNNPLEGTKPSPSSLESDVIIRQQQNPGSTVILSPWSDPSSSVSIPAGQKVLVGNVDQPRRMRAGDEPEAKVLAVVWDQGQAMDVPAEVTVRRGSVINGTVETEAIDPALGRIRKLQDYHLQTNTIVLDIAGGEPMRALGLNTQLQTPGAMLVMDAEGNLQFHHEIQDSTQYEKNKIPPPEVEEFVPEEPPAREENREERRGNRREEPRLFDERGQDEGDRDFRRGRRRGR